MCSYHFPPHTGMHGRDIAALVAGCAEADPYSVYNGTNVFRQNGLHGWLYLPLLAVAAYAPHVVK